MTEAADELPPFQPLHARLAGRPVDTALRTDVSAALSVALHEWIARAQGFDSGAPQRVALRLNLPMQKGWLLTIQAVDDEHLLEVLDALLQLHGGLDNEEYMAGGGTVRTRYGLYLRLLDEALTDAGAAYKVADSGRQLVRRVDPTVEEAAAHAAAAAAPTVADLLRKAWRETYGMQPDPNGAYSCAVRAVEEVAAPLVLPNNNRPTLGQIRDHLRAASAKWEFGLLDTNRAPTVDPLVSMIDRLWTGNVARHGGPNTRDQTQAEAEIAVHLATALVHLLSTGALTPKSIP